MKGDWKEFVPAPEIRAAIEPDARAFRREVADGHLTVIVGSWAGKFHLSISHRLSIVDPSTGGPAPGRIPSWEEIRDARYDLAPDEATMAMLLPPRGEYINLHPTTMHLYQVEGE